MQLSHKGLKRVGIEALSIKRQRSCRPIRIAATFGGQTFGSYVAAEVIGFCLPFGLSGSRTGCSSECASGYVDSLGIKRPVREKESSQDSVSPILRKNANIFGFVRCVARSEVRTKNAAGWIVNTLLKIDSLFWRNGCDARLVPCAWLVQVEQAALPVCPVACDRLLPAYTLGLYPG
jgi:hypothetical protein